VDVYPTRNGQPVQDLRAEDFELLENGAPQQIQAFEHIVLTPAGAQSTRVEPNSVREAEQMASEARNRVFVIFLDVPHVAVEGSHAIKAPLIKLMDRVLAADDLVAVMTPDMAASHITLARKTEAIAKMLEDNWTWGHRFSIRPMDDRELEYESCYPNPAQKALVAEMIERRRERMVLDALRDLVHYLGTIREERKAILTVSSGWALYRPQPGLTKLRGGDQVPGNDPIGVDEFGKLRVGSERRREGEPESRTSCDRERMYLASIDDEDYFRLILDEANRNNASFYPIDPRGLAAFDFPLGPAAPPPLAVDHASLRTRLENLRTLADATDGLAVLDTNDLDRGLRRIADDLTSYYLLGYYSTNTSLDGGYRKITVKVTRPGVDVRARRGYRAATAEEVNASRAAAAAPVPEAAKAAAAALATLGRLRPDQRFSVHAVPVENGAGATPALWIAGEVLPAAREFGAGGTVAIDISGAASGTATATLERGERAFLVKVPIASRDAPIEIRARATASGGGEPYTERVRLEPESVQPLIFRRGPATGNRQQPAADLRFSRTERVHFELPIPAAATPAAGRLLDRNAQPLQVPVQVADRRDEDGRHWLTADATLSALGAGDYVVEVAYQDAGTERRVLTAIRVTR
jgi:VWFA-related protein